MKSVTYIIMTCNRGCFLERNIKEQFLSGYFDLKGLDFNIVIVDDGSIDGSIDKIKQLCQGKLGISLKYIYLKRRAASPPAAGQYFYSDSAPKNTGVLHSNSEFIYIADSDCYICSPNAFQELTKIGIGNWLCPNCLRCNNKTTLSEFWEKNWTQPLKCYEYLKKFGKGWKKSNESPGLWHGAHESQGMYFGPDFNKVGTGLVGMRRSTFYHIGGVPPIRTSYGTDRALLGAFNQFNITKDKIMSSKIFVIHFPVPYTYAMLLENIPYLDEHYIQIDGITVIKKEYLDIYDLKL